MPAMPINPLLRESSYACRVGYGNTYEMRKIRKYTEWQSMPYKEKSLYDEFEKIKILAGSGGIPKIIIDNALESGSNTLITCETGLGKSACILLYYMMKREQTTLADSHRYINSLRPGINSDDKKSGFRPNCVEILIDEEKKMYKNSKVSHGKIPSCDTHVSILDKTKTTRSTCF